MHGGFRARLFRCVHRNVHLRWRLQRAGDPEGYRQWTQEDGLNLELPAFESDYRLRRTGKTRSRGA